MSAATSEGESSGESRLLLAEALSEPETRPFAGGRVALFTRRGPGKQGPNEDAAAILEVGPDRGVLAVADGCGGMDKGEEAARLAVQELERAVRGALARDPDADLRGPILEGIEVADEKIRGLGVGAGTTLSVVEVAGREVRTYHAGDSRTLVTSYHGKLKALTPSHSPVGYAVEAGLLGEDEALHHDELYVVANVLGTDDLHIEVGRKRRLAAKDTVVVGSDGLFDNLYLDEIVERTRKGRLDVAAQGLLADCMRRMTRAIQVGPPTEDWPDPGKPDDLTFLLYRPGR